MNTILNGDEENEKYFCLEMKKLICSGKLQEAIQIICNFMSKWCISIGVPFGN